MHFVLYTDKKNAAQITARHFSHSYFALFFRSSRVLMYFLLLFFCTSHILLYLTSFCTSENPWYFTEFFCNYPGMPFPVF